MITIHVPYFLVVILFLALLGGFVVTAQVHRPKVWRYITGVMLLGAGGLVIRPFDHTEISTVVLLLGFAAYFSLSMWPFIKCEWKDRTKVDGSLDKGGHGAH